jgi:tRNA dimethylallyltransferase
MPAELVSADSAQAYRGVPLLTNQAAYPTRLVAIWELEREGSVGEYQQLAHAAIDEILASGRTPIVVGGTGLYLRAALADLELPPPPEPGVRARFERLYDRLGPEHAHAALKERDPAAAAQVHHNDRRRVVRALELADAGHSLRPERDGLWAEDWRHPTLVFGLDVPRDELWRRIEARTSVQFEAGVEDEVRRALAGRLSTSAAKIMGLQEIALMPATEAGEAFGLRNRQYASYQRKWMQRIPGLIRVDADRSPDEVADEIFEVARARQRLSADRAVRSEP